MRACHAEWVSNIPLAVNHFGRFYTPSTSSVRVMAEQHERLQRARLEAGFKRKVDAVRRFDFNPNTYKSNENGSMPFSYKAAEDYGAAFGVEAEWLYAGTGPIRSGAPAKRASEIVTIPLISWVSAGQLAEPDFQIPDDDLVQLVFGDLGPGNWFATTVVGDSMDRISPEGSRIVVNRAESDPVSGGLYVCSRRGATTYKRFEADPWRLEPMSTNPANKTIFPKKDDEWSVVGRVRRTILDL